MRRRGNAGVGAFGETTDPSINSMSSTLSPSVKAELELDSECDRLNWSTFTILGITSCVVDFPKGDSGCLRVGLRDGVPPLVGELLFRAIGRVGVRGEGRELEDEVEDGGLGMAERLGVLGFEVRSILFGGVTVFRGGGDGRRVDSLPGGNDERSEEI
jgi:hypothetical protein